MADDFLHDHFKINIGQPGADGLASVTLSIVDMKSLADRTHAWCEGVIRAMEASGVPGLSIDEDRAVPLFLSGTSPEAAAVLLIAECRAAVPELAASPWGDCPADLPSLVAAGVMGLEWAEPDTVFHHGEEIADEKANRHGQVREIVAAAMALADKSAKAFTCAARHQNTGANDPADCGWPTCGCDPYADKVVSALDEAGCLDPALNAAKATLTMHRPAVVAENDLRRRAGLAAHWEGADLVTHLRSWPAAPPDTDAFSAAYAGGLMQQAADEIDRLTRELARWDRPISEG